MKRIGGHSDHSHVMELMKSTKVIAIPNHPTRHVELMKSTKIIVIPNHPTRHVELMKHTKIIVIPKGQAAIQRVT